MPIETKGSFLEPTKHSRPLVRWWWPGVDVEEEQLLRELAEIDEQGFGGAEIQTLAPGMPRHLHRDRERYEKVHRFMQPYYYEMVGAVLDEARKRNLAINLAVSSGWPTGGNYVKNEEAQQNLLVGYAAVMGGRYRGHLPRAEALPSVKSGRSARRTGVGQILAHGGPKPVLKYVVAARPQRRWDAARSLGLFRPRTILLDAASLTDLTEYADEDGFLEWEFPRRGLWYIFAFYTRAMGPDHLTAVVAEDPEKKAMVIDHLSAAPLERWLNHHFDRGRAHFEDHFGRRLCGYFIDNPRLGGEEAGLLWSADFKKEFGKRRGYDITPFLPVLFTPTRDYYHTFAPAADRDSPCFDIEEQRIGDRIRYDYHLTVSDLFNERFLGTLAEWGGENRLRSKVEAHGFRSDLLRSHGFVDLPVTEQDHAGGEIDFLRIAGSAAIIHGKALVAARAMGWRGRDYKTTPLKWKVAADRLFAAGINQLVYHGFPYRDPAAECPEAYPFSDPHLPASRSTSTNFSRINEFWEFYPMLNDYVTRCQHILQQGKVICNVALFFPLLGYPDIPLGREELSCGYLDEDDAPLEGVDGGARERWKRVAAKKWLKAERRCTDNLGANGYYYTHINEDSLLRGRVEGGKLLVGMAEIEAVIFNHIEHISLPLARKLEEMAAGGVRIIFMGALPQQQPGYSGYQDNDPRIKEIMRALNEKEKAFVTEEKPTPVLKAKGVLPNLVFEREQRAIHYIHKQTADTDYYFLRSGSRFPQRVRFSLPHGYRTPYILDPFTGEVEEATVHEAVGDKLFMELDFAPYGSFLLEMKDAPSTSRHHLLRGPPLRTGRVRSRLAAYAAKPGEYRFLLNSGEIKKVVPAALLPEPLSINRWQFATTCKDLRGREQRIELKMQRLEDWRAIPELEYCSSRGCYEAEFDVDESYLAADLNLLLSLGRVGDVAVVTCNGHRLDPLLMPPYETDVTSHIQAGKNNIVVEVIPTLNNQLIGFGRQGGVAYGNHRHKTNLMPSGLIGPVAIIPRFKMFIT